MSTFTCFRKSITSLVLGGIISLIGPAASQAQVDSVAGGSLFFNGFSSYVDTRFTEHLKKFTVEAWVRSPNAPSANQGKGPVHYENNFQLNWDHVANSARGAVVIKDSLGSWHGASFGPLEGQRWYHLCATYDGDTLKAYTNGVLITANAAPTGPPTPETFSLKLGKHAKLSNPQFEFHEGEVDEVRVWDRVLGDLEIRTYMHLTRMANEPGLKLYYQLNRFQADSTLEAVSGRYSARLVSNPLRKRSNVAVARGVSSGNSFTGGGVISTYDNGLMITLNSLNNVTIISWALHDGIKGTKPGMPFTYGPSRQYIWQVFDTTGPITTTQTSLLLDSTLNRLLGQYAPREMALYWRPHYSDSTWTMIGDSISMVAWGSGFARFNYNVPPGQLTIAPRQLVSIPLQQFATDDVRIATWPSSWQVQLMGSLSSASWERAMLFDAQGKAVWQGRAMGQELGVPHQSLAPGVYHLRAVVNRGGMQHQVVRKLLKY